MDDNWIKEPPHPETEWAACTTYAENAEIVKPLIDVPLRDTSICVGLDGLFYMTGIDSTGSSQDAFKIWTSRDLVEWHLSGAAIVDFPESVAVKPVFSSIRLHFFRNTFWMTCGMRQGGTGLLKSMTGKSEGPYQWQQLMTTDGHDAAMFEDDDGQLYWVYGDGKIARMKEDLSALDELPQEILVPEWQRNNRRKPTQHEKHIGTHGAFLFKKNGLYFLFGAEAFKRMGSDGIDTFVAVSDSIYGPYSRRYLAIPNGGAATLFHGPNGSVHAAFSGCGSYSPVQDRPAAIPMTLALPEFIRPVPEVILEKGAVAQLHPISDMLIRDPHICLGPDGTYVLTGTRNLPHNDFWDGNDELHVWTSPDLKEWTHLAKVWSLRENGSWEKNVYNRPCLWAPESIYAKGTFWITYSVKGGGTCLLKSVSGRADGPYVDMGRMTNTNIDSSFFEDEDGQIYYVWQNGKIAKMKPSMSGFEEDPRLLLTVDGETVGYEGAFIVKYKGKYILGAAEWNGDRRVEGTYDLMYSVSDQLYGPYSSRRVAVPHGGHGTMFVDRQGRLMSTLFGNDRTAPFRARLGIVPLAVRMDKEDLLIHPDLREA